MASDLAKAGAEVKLHDAFEGSMHAKVIVADEHEAIVGSANFTYSGSHRNLEAGIRLRGPSVAVLRNAMLSMFDKWRHDCVSLLDGAPVRSFGLDGAGLHRVGGQWVETQI